MCCVPFLGSITGDHFIQDWHTALWGEIWDMRCRCWADWTHYACQWQTNAPSDELSLSALLLIPLSPLETLVKYNILNFKF